MKLHHLGMAVPNIDNARKYMIELGAKVTSEIFEDKIQNVSVQFINLGGQPIELVAPLSTPSPIDGILKKNKHWYHLCYEVSNLDETIQKWNDLGAILLGDPVPAKAFNGRRIIFMMTKQKDLFEFVESS